MVLFGDLFIFISCIGMLCLHVCKCSTTYVCTWHPCSPEDRPKTLETGVPGPLQEQQVLITIFPAPVAPSETHLHPTPQLQSRIPTQDMWGETWKSNDFQGSFCSELESEAGIWNPRRWRVSNFEGSRRSLAYFTSSHSTTHVGFTLCHKAAHVAARLS